MDIKKIPSTLKRELYVSLENHGTALVLAMMVLCFIPWWILQTFYYWLTALFLMTMMLPFIESWRPKQKLSANGKAVFVSGCGSGFGYSVVQQLDRLGFEVYAACHFVEKEGPQQLKRSCSERVHVIPLEVTSDASVEEAVNYVKRTIGKKKLWALVNNAGIVSGFEIFWTSIDEIQHAVEVNTIGMIRLTKALLPLLIKNKGRIVTVASAAGRITLPLMVPYCLSKHATISFCEGLRLEMYRFGIKVITIEPFLYKTPLTDEERIMCSLLKLWNKSPPYIKQFYPENYMELLKPSPHKIVTVSTSNNIQEVVKCIEDAMIAKDPKYSYHPGTLTCKFLFWLHNHTPKQWIDTLLHFYIY